MQLEIIARKILMKQIYILNLLHIILVKQKANIKCDEINIINDNGFNLHNNSLLNNDNRYMKVV